MRRPAAVAVSICAPYSRFRRYTFIRSPSRRLTGRSLTRRVVLAMIKRRPAAAGLPPSTCCHTFRATGIKAYLSNGWTLEHAQQIAAHASPNRRMDVPPTLATSGTM